jgi:hypothetical protein
MKTLIHVTTIIDLFFVSLIFSFCKEELELNFYISEGEGGVTKQQAQAAEVEVCDRTTEYLYHSS